MCVCNCAVNSLASEMLEAEASKAELLKAVLPIDRPINHRLFNWITILLLTGWILVVAVAANTAQVEKPAEESTARAFIKNLL